MEKTPKTEEFKKMELLCKPFLSKFRAFNRPKTYLIPFIIKFGSFTSKVHVEFKLTWGDDDVVAEVLNRWDVRQIVGSDMVAYIEETLVYETSQFKNMESSIYKLRTQLDELSELHFGDGLKLWNEYVADKL